MRISAIIPTYNYGKYIARAIQSVLDQTHPVREILVIDDGSSDNTRDVVAAFGDKVRYIPQTNRGVSAARNAGIRESKGDWLAFLDADDWWALDKLERQCRVASEHPQTALIYGAAILCAESDGSQTSRAETPPHLLWPTLRYKNCIAPSTVLVRRDVVIANHGFNEALRTCEDWDLWVKLARRYVFGFVDEPVAWLRVGPTSASAHAENVLSDMEKILKPTLLADLGWANRCIWRRKIRAAQLFSAALNARGIDSMAERRYLLSSLLQWPSLMFDSRRWKAAFLLLRSRP